MIQLGPDTGIHITISTALVGLVANAVYERWQRGKNGDGKCRYDDQCLRDIRDGIKELVTIVKMKGGL